MQADPGKDYNRGHRRRLKEKFLAAGAGAFLEHEIVELLLTYAIPRRDVKPLAKDLLAAFGSLRGILDAETEELGAIAGVGLHSALLLKLIKEVGALYLQQKARGKTQLACTAELLDYCKTVLGGKKDEEFCVIYLNAQDRKSTRLNSSH